MSSDNTQFGPIRSVLWPIHRSEVKKVVSMLVLLFLLCICYNMIRNLKDTVILTASQSGAEVLPFLKVWGMLPGAIAATWVYTRLCRKFARETVFYIVVSSFLAYFLLFAFLIQPHSEQLHLTKAGEFLTEHLPSGFKGVIAMVRNWSFTLFYVISELWAVVVLSVLFWGFTNDVTEVSQAKRTYGILNIGSNVAPMLGGAVGILCSKFSTSRVGAWNATIETTMVMVAALGILAMGVFYWINRKVITIKETGFEEGGHKKPRLSVRESLKYIIKSPYLTSLALIVIGYNVSINITDVLWKAQLKQYFTDPTLMIEHMHKITMGTGFFATIGGVFFSMMVTRLGWTFTALLTPLVMALMGAFFFLFLFSGDAISSLAITLFGAAPFALTVYFGSIQNCLSKAGKYSLFDASKEMAFLPLDREAKLKGKAAIDGLGSGIGKSGASIMYQGLIILFGSVASSTPYIFVVLVVVFFAWISSVLKLGRLFKKSQVPTT